MKPAAQLPVYDLLDCFEIHLREQQLLRATERQRLEGVRQFLQFLTTGTLESDRRTSAPQ